MAGPDLAYFFAMKTAVVENATTPRGARYHATASGLDVSVISILETT